MKFRIIYLFDPLCGWCYGATPALQEVFNSPDTAVEMIPTGLFTGQGARVIDGDFAGYAWQNDQRIAQLTGQTFSEAYKTQILGAPGQRFDSGPAALALTAVHLTQPGEEFRVLKAIQHHRYVLGLDITALPVLTELLQDLGLQNAATLLADNSEALNSALQQRYQSARAIMSDNNVSGVPTLFQVHHDKLKQIPRGLLFESSDAFINHIRSTMASQAAFTDNHHA